MFRVTYYALKDTTVDGEVRHAGDLVPEAMSWPYLASYVQTGQIAPVLVATLPAEQQDALVEWAIDKGLLTDIDEQADDPGDGQTDQSAATKGRQSKKTEAA